jgi:hypothetical protein
MRDLIKEIREQDVYFFPTPDITLTNGRFGWGGPSVLGEWWAPNPPSVPPFTYYLKQRLSSGKVTVEIYDDKNNLVQSMPGTVRRGINKVFWNLKGTPPKVASGSTKLDGAGFTSPMVLPGTYTVKLVINDKTYTSKVNCVHDNNNKDLSVEDRILVYEKSMQLQKLYDQLNKTIDSISYYQKRVKSDSISFAKNKTAKVFYEDLQKVKADLMATKKTSIFADEERIREKVSTLYGIFCNIESKPNSTQLQAIDVLQQEFDAKEEFFTKTIAKHRTKIPELMNTLN